MKKFNKLFVRIIVLILPLTQNVGFSSTGLSIFPSLRQSVLTRAQQALSQVQQQHLTTSNLITIVDYSLPSTAKRLWVIDTAKQQLLFNVHVTHGKNSGKKQARHFSNQPNSHQSNLGSLLTGHSYWGKHGYAMRLTGLDKGINDNARKRHIVMHGATYASERFVQQNGTLGRSWGCFAVNYHDVKAIIDTIKDGTLLFAYSPNLLA